MMILYFSGTGNSKYVAKAIHSVTGGELVSINQLIKSRKAEPLISQTPFVFVCPSYAARPPKVVEKFIKESSFEGNKNIYFVMTAGETVGSSEKYIKKLCLEKDFIYMGLGAIAMPENYITLYTAPDKETSKNIIERAVPKIKEIAEDILKGNILQPDSSMTKNPMMSTIINPIFYKFIVNARGFHVTDKCVSCRKCENICPLNNVKIVNGKPEWGKDCTHCMACICGCPKEAIEYKKSTKEKRRYYLDC
jgi:ferredoxin